MASFLDIRPEKSDDVLVCNILVVGRRLYVGEILGPVLQLPFGRRTPEILGDIHFDRFFIASSFRRSPVAVHLN